MVRSPPSNIAKLNQNAKGDSKFIDELNHQVNKGVILNIFLLKHLHVFCAYEPYFFFFQVTELKATVDGLEKERDFYFGKLRDIEVICQEMEEQSNGPIVQKILDILYATEVSFCMKNNEYTHGICYKKRWPKTLLELLLFESYMC